MSKVFVAKTSPETVLSDYQQLLKTANINGILDPKLPIFLKDNISWHFPYLSANTTPWQLEGTILGLKNLGFENISCVQNETVVTNAFKGEKLNKYVPIFKKYDIPVRYNFKKDDMKWVLHQPKEKLLVLHDVFPEGILIPDYFYGKNVVHLPTVKCHIYTTTTGAMKNAFGGLLNTKRHYTHSVIHETLVDLLQIQKEIHPGVFAVMDGTVCGNGPGPRTMIPIEKDYILASDDQVAIDAVASKLMGFEPMNIPYIRLAHERGLGIGDFKQIEVVGMDIEKVNFQFKVGDNLASRFGDACWFGPLKSMQNLFFRTPLVNLFIFGSFFYHDYLWWPFKGKRKMEYFRKNMRWGQLFDRYEE
jgi:uncharacterized protein (DUF362 family)